MENVAAATTAMSRTSSRLGLILGMKYAAKPTVEPSSRYLARRAHAAPKFGCILLLILYEEKNLRSTEMFPEDARVSASGKKSWPREKEMSPIPCKVRDFLEQDQPVRGQNYACLSFLSPTDAVSSREAFQVSKFLGAFCDEASQVLADAEKRASTEDDRRVLANLRERYAYVFDRTILKEEYDKYCATYAEQIKKDWSAQNDDAACVYGIKIRGAYETLAEAQSRAQQLKRSDPNFSVYVCEIGCWVPWSPSPDEIADAEYSETQLNTLMKRYKDNMALKDEYYEARKREMTDATAASASEVLDAMS
jgi:hypothetical protein